MRLTFIGAAHEVTGSMTLLECNGTRILIDCGMEQGVDAFVNAELPISAADVDLVLVTHAHVDHTGNLPLLYKNGFRGKVFATTETCNLCDIMLRDCAHIQMSEAEYATRKEQRAGGKVVEPLYDLEDVAGLMRLFYPCEYGRQIAVCDGVHVRFTDIGHLLGSACIEVWLRENGIEKKIVFSGDVGNTNQPIINDPKPVLETDYLMIESTYGNRNHDAAPTDHVRVLAEVIQTTLDRGGNVIIPAFAVGRTQEILYFIRQIKNEHLVTGHDNFPVYVDSPLANEATSVFLQCDVSCLDEETRAVMASGKNPIFFPGLHTYVTTEQSKALNFDKEPKVIISASGMCDAGRIRHHLKYNLWRKECTVLFVGYQAVGTLGRLLYDGAKKVKLFGDEIAVEAEIRLLPGVSGHADQRGLLDWVGNFSPKPVQIFVNHGDDEACQAFARLLNDEYGQHAFAPYSGTSYDLAAGQFCTITDGIPIMRKTTPARTAANAAYTRVQAAAKRLSQIAQKSEGWANKDLKRFAELMERLADQWEE